MKDEELSRSEFRRNVILFFALGVTALFLWMIRDFLQPLFLAAISSALLYPVYFRLERRLKRRWLASLITVCLFAVAALAVIGGLLGLVVKQAIELRDVIAPELTEQRGQHNVAWVVAWLRANYPALGEFLPDAAEVTKLVNQVVSTVSDFLIRSMSSAPAGIALFLLQSFVMLYALYFFLIDGRKILRHGKTLLPLSESEQDVVLERFVSVTRATLKGSLLIGVLQGGLCGVALWMVGIESWAILSLIMLALSVVQGVGPPIVWVPALIVVYSRGQVTEAIVAAIWCGAVVGTLDNLLRPHLVGKDAKLPDLLILVGTLGGIALFGVVGLIVGPIICALFLTAWEIYRTAFGRPIPRRPIDGDAVGSAPGSKPRDPVDLD